MAKVVAEFKKVSLEQFTKDIKKLIVDGVISEKLLERKDKEELYTIEELYNDLVLPTRKTKASAGHDFIAPFDIEIQPGQTIVVPSGIRAVFSETDYFLALYPRSGQGFKFRLRLNNTVGIIDADYAESDNEGHIMVKLSNEGDKLFKCEKGQAFCQGLFQEYFIALGNEDPELIRNGGFGSTDK